MLEVFVLALLQVLIDMDQRDEQSGKMEETRQHLRTAYRQFTLIPRELIKPGGCVSRSEEDGTTSSSSSGQDPEIAKPGLTHPTLQRLPISGIRDVITWLFSLIPLQELNQVRKTDVLKPSSQK